jgi:hypothetical protein
MHKKKKFGILTVKEAEIRADKLEVKVFRMQEQFDEAVEEYNRLNYDDECSEETLGNFEKKIYGLRQHMQAGVLEIQMIECGLSLIEMIKEGYDVWVN